MSIAIASIPAFPIQPASSPPSPPPPPQPRTDDAGSQAAPRRAVIDTSVRPLVDVSSLTTAQEAASPTTSKTEQTTVKSGEDCSDCDDKAPGELSEEEKAVVTKLRSTDQQVRAHERAHANAGGAYAGSPSFTYETGPDGKRYAVAGHVPIDVSPVNGDPEATIAKMDTVLRAALAPSDPSGADRAVAATAAKQKAEAQSQAAEQSREALQEALGGPEEGDKAAPKPDTPQTAENSDAAGDSGETGFQPFVPASDFGGHDDGQDNPFQRKNRADDTGFRLNTGRDDNAPSPFDTVAGAGLQPDQSRAAFARASNAYTAHNTRDAIDLPGIL